MEKRFQVFISSTYEDLREARAAVSEALLRANCFPAGMELFPAADSEQFEFIKEVIDQSDYYLVVSAGRYGSISPETGLSYTEMEYDYAVETGKPVIRLLHRDPLNKLTGERIEQTDEGREKLEAFRAKLKTGSLVAFWDDAKELKAETLLALQDVQRRKPAVGWVRGDVAASIEMREENLFLREEVARLKATIDASRNFEGGTWQRIPALIAVAGQDAEELADFLKGLFELMKDPWGAPFDEVSQRLSAFLIDKGSEIEPNLLGDALMLDEMIDRVEPATLRIAINEGHLSGDEDESSMRCTALEKLGLVERWLRIEALKQSSG